MSRNQSRMRKGFDGKEASALSEVTKAMKCQLLAVLSLTLLACSAQAAGKALELHARGRELMPGSTNQFAVINKTLEWAPEKTAIIVCDMWDQHWCKGATARVGEMAPRMNEVLKEARRRGVFVIHAPSDTMKFYADWPQRRRAQDAPKATPPHDVSGWRALNNAKEPPLPIDDSDGGCDDWPPCPSGGPWKRQIAVLEIAPEDAISDKGDEVYNLLQQQKRDNVIIMGVHENMCVLGRPFSIRQMVTLGKNVVLMRDMTDTMYNSRRRPYVSHFAGTDLVAEHIEKYWCPTVTSADILGGQPFQFKADRRPKILFIIGEQEYHTWETLPRFAEQELAWRGFITEFANAPVKEGNDFTNWQAVAGADLLVVSSRRRTPPTPMLQAIRKHLESGKPLVGLRTASHAFAAKPPDSQHASWDTFDRDVLGAKYEGHFGNELGPQVAVAPGAERRPILTGVAGFHSQHSLYRSRELAPSTGVLLTGRIKVNGQEMIEPVAWINTNANRRVFYTSLGGPEDFKEAAFNRLFLNAILWSLDQPVPPAERIPGSTAALSGKQWQPLRVPGTWEDNSQQELGAYDGIAWYRCRAHVPEAWKGKAVDLWIERVDNAYEAYVNGVKVGSAGAFPPNYRNGDTAADRHRVNLSDLKFGADNLIAIRVYDAGGRGGFKGDAPALLTRDEAIKLEGTWDFHAGDNLAWAKATADVPPPAAEFAQVIDAAGVSARTSQHQVQEQPLAPAESLARFKTADDLVIEQVLAEPIVRQPVSLTFDERGRLWVVEYLQYPEPAGLKLMSRDNVWRAVYDKVPPPPPRHFRGQDRISIHEDTNGDGTFDVHKVFVEGLNITTSVARGRGGVWVMNPPYLLFYPDRNQDDVPDGDPEVRLSGFGLEDTHSVANSLHWGPDGWLYGCQGSTVTGNIFIYDAEGRPINNNPIYSQGQNIWRYHPEARRYEVFAEGGGNAFGLEIDAKGRIFSGHNGGNTRGFHYVQGGYLQKGFEKHGPLSNPYAFGYFPPMAHNQAERFTHTFVVYDGGALPDAYDGKLLGVEPLQGRVVLSDIQPDHSSFRTRDLGYPITTTDQWFRPVDIKVGPDGALYVADWYDRQVNHYRNHEGQIDRENGRVYRVRARNASAAGRFDLSNATDAALVEYLKHKNKWFRQEAQRLLADRHSAALVEPLRALTSGSTGQLALEALWALRASGGFTPQTALELLNHSEPHVRAWTVRLIGDAPTQELWGELGGKLASLAKTEPDLEVRSQLACTAKRLSAGVAMPILRNLCTRDQDAGDPRLPLLIWWAIEAKADSDRDAVVSMFGDPGLWKTPIVEKHIAERVIRRYAQAGTRKDLLTCARLIELAPDRAQAARLVAALEQGFKGRSVSGLPDELAEAIAKSGGESIPWGVRRGQSDAIRKALEVIADAKADRAKRLEYIRLFGEVKQPQCVRVLLDLLAPGLDASVAKAALAALQQYDQAAIGLAVASALPSLRDEAQTAAFVLLGSRPAWAAALLEAVDSGAIPRKSVPQDTIRKIKLYSDSHLAALFEKHYGAGQEATQAELQAKIQSVATAVRDGAGNPYEGQKVFTMACAVCHKLFGQGGQIGPDLTTYKRDDLDVMLLNILNPSAEIREGYENYFVTTRDGRTLSGFLADKDNRVLVLRAIDGENSVVPQENVLSMKSTGVSLMPEGLLDVLEPQQVRDLFSYLRSTQPLVR